MRFGRTLENLLDASVPAAPARNIRPSSARRRVTLLTAVGLVVGLLIGGVLAFRPTPSAPSGAAVAAQTLDERLAALEATVERTPDDVGAWRDLAGVAVQRAAEVGDPAFYDLAERALERAEALEPGAPQTAIGQGVLALARHEFDDGLRHGRSALEQLPGSTAALAVVVDAEVELGFYDDAADHAQQMLDRRPGLPALSRASYLRELRGDLDGAATAMRQAETAAGNAPDRAMVAALRGDLALLGADLDAAGDHYARALRDSPELVAARIGMARVTAAQGDTGQAVTDLEELVDRRPQPAAVALLADLQQELGRESEAAGSRDLVRTLTTLQADQQRSTASSRPAGQAVDLELALFEADHGDAGRAVELARAAYTERPDNVYAADALAWALARSGQVDAARPLVDDAVRLGSIDPSVRYHAAWIVARSDGFAAARDDLRFLTQRAEALPATYQRDAADLARDAGIDVPGAWR